MTAKNKTKIPLKMLLDRNRKLTTPEEQGLATVLYTAYENSNSYGKKFNPVLRVNGWLLALQDDYTIEQMIQAILHHMKTRDTMPTPSVVQNYVQGEGISKVEYISATKERQRLKSNGEWNEFLPEAITIQKYEDENKKSPTEINKEQAKEIMKTLSHGQNNRKMIE